MIIHRSYKYGDPAKVIEIEQEGSCRLCRYKVKIWELEIFAKHNQKPEKRCKSYEERHGQLKQADN